MLPEAQHPPALCLKPLCVLRVPLTVAPKLLLPEFPVVLRHRRMQRASMPKATVDEDGNPRADEDHVGTCSADPVLQPVAQTKRPYIATQAQLRAGIASLDAGHHLTT